MKVLDASAYAEALTAATPLGSAVRDLLQSSARWHVPSIFHAEVLSAVRGLSLGGHLNSYQASVARKRLMGSRFVLHGLPPYAERIWDLRQNLTVYDAWYVAIAETLNCSLVTTDRRLAEAPGIRCDVDLIR